ncbi:hypothetical protein ACIP98_14355 [Streptomyces sp. NPDC088354]|uniref:hypothetical protein n=1 Tax=unclassified Streptomyces TaxID=2593676 RepID=UPI0029AA9A1F|nr:hypothetical protein [Streptomyces sp. MI02-7b]MDX3070964.1 hypothetical protein [Streptomyces sp. MI02-7b]
MAEYPSWDLPDELWEALDARFEQVGKETGWEYQDHLSTAPGIKLGGYPGWCQDPRWPDCRDCGTPMDHLLTVESAEESDSRQAWTPVEDRGVRSEGPGLVLGDLGGVYFFECRTCPGLPFAHRFDA